MRFEPKIHPRRAVDPFVTFEGLAIRGYKLATRRHSSVGVRMLHYPCVVTYTGAFPCPSIGEAQKRRLYQSCLTSIMPLYSQTSRLKVQRTRIPRVTSERVSISRRFR